MELFKTIQVFNHNLKGKLVSITSYREELVGLYFVKYVDDESLTLVNPNGDIYELEINDLGYDGTNMEVVITTNETEFEKEDKYKEIVYMVKDILNKDFAVGMMSHEKYDAVNNENKISEIRRLLNNNSITSGGR